MAASYTLGMLVRYHPALWTGLVRQESGDGVTPLIFRLVDLLENDFPQIVLHYLSPLPK